MARYAIYNWFDDWLPSGELASRHIEARKAQSSIYKDHPLFAFPCGLSSDPVRSLSLSTTWPHFRENHLTDNEHYSELNPSNAPSWTARCHRYASRAVQFNPHGGQSDFVWLSARTPHGAYVW